VIEIRQEQEFEGFPVEVQEALKKHPDLVSQPGKRSEG
jgi:hypothetical protein